MEEKTPLFVGYPILEGWMEALLPDRPVLALQLIEHGPEQGGLRTDTLLVVCQQIDACGHVHYCRLRAATLTRCYGEPFQADWKEREAAWQSLWKAVKEILEQRGVPYRTATVAPPTSMRFLEGRVEALTFDPETKRYIYKSAEQQRS